jgi:hypothetical protein
VNEDTRMKAQELFLDSSRLMSLRDKAETLVSSGLVADETAAYTLLESMGEQDDVARRLDELQATYTRLTDHRGRLVRYYDDAPDGDPRKADALARLDQVGTTIRNVERKIEELLEP